ncbi:MAG TPA: hypothetical protein PLP30_00040 [Clostridia bacterium]|nr:hypothetical protein [Clostridia bacterium]HRX42477.1 hypothetical protein [Clostridia bacterium]
MSGMKKLITTSYWLKKNTDEIAMIVERNVNSTLMMNKAII